MQLMKRAKEHLRKFACFILLLIITIFMNSRVYATEEVAPTPNQYFEMKATQIIETEENGKQVIFELWGHDIDFKGLSFRFDWDESKFSTSNILTNEASSDASKYFAFEDEFSGILEYFALPYDVEGSGLRAMITFNPPTTVAGHVIQKDDVGKLVTTEGGVLIGKFSFKMSSEEFDISSFKLVGSSENSPTTGIKIDISLLQNYQANTTFRFSDATASKDSSLKDLSVTNMENTKEYLSNLEKNKLDYPITITEYIDSVNLKATTNDEKATMKIKVPKKDEEGNIIYEEKDLVSSEPMEINLIEIGGGDTKITVQVTAEDGKTKSEYIVTIKRPFGTIKGKVVGVTATDTPNNGAKLYIYNQEDIEKVFSWESKISEFTTKGSDKLNEELHKIKETLYKQIDNQGVYLEHIIPGTYTILIDKIGYLDLIYINVTLDEGEEIDFGDYTLIPGDTNKDGIIQVKDKVAISKINGAKVGDLNFNEACDLNADGAVQVKDKVLISKNNGKKREIIKYVK